MISYMAAILLIIGYNKVGTNIGQVAFICASLCFCIMFAMMRDWVQVLLNGYLCGVNIKNLQRMYKQSQAIKEAK